MSRAGRVVLVLSLAGLLVGGVTAPADAAKRRVPFGFFGTVLNPALGDLSDSALDAQMGLMARSGVESVRVSFIWGNMEPAPGQYNWAPTDRLVAAAARHGISVLANVYATPGWASAQPNSIYAYRYAPTDPQVFPAFMRSVVQRYGPRGTFWAFYRGLPRIPIREWQIWNEQVANWMWASTPWPPSYTRFLRSAYSTIHGADRGARVVAGSLVSIGRYSQWAQVRDLYRAGAKRYFDVISVHTFTDGRIPVKDSVQRVVKILDLVRAGMRRYGDSRKPIIVTEMSWPAAIGRVPSSRLLGLETTPSGQVKRIKLAYSELAKASRRLRLTQVDWYEWASEYNANSPQSDVSYRFSGLVRFATDAGGRPLPGSAFVPMPVLKTYTSVAASYEGCRKRADARRCR